MESGSHETPGGEAKKAKSEQTDASTGRPKEAGAASAIPLGRWNLRELFFLDGGQLGIGILMLGSERGGRMGLGLGAP